MGACVMFACGYFRVSHTHTYIYTYIYIYIYMRVQRCSIKLQLNRGSDRKVRDAGDDFISYGRTRDFLDRGKE